MLFTYNRSSDGRTGWRRLGFGLDTGVRWRDVLKKWRKKDGRNGGQHYYPIYLFATASGSYSSSSSSSSSLSSSSSPSSLSSSSLNLSYTLYNYYVYVYSILWRSSRFCFQFLSLFHVLSCYAFYSPYCTKNGETHGVCVCVCVCVCYAGRKKNNTSHDQWGL